MARFNKICIVGVGLIGGSLGMALKKKGLAKLVVGVVRKDSTAKAAMRKKALDIALFNLKEGVKGADLVILAASVSVIEAQFKSISPVLKKGALVIDVGSSKLEIERAASRALGAGVPRHRKWSRGTPAPPVFVGCHPMAGSEKTGVENASADLFEGAICFQTKSNTKVSALWKAVGAKPVVLAAKRHDEWVAKASHLPHLISFSLFQDLKFPKGVPVNPSLKSFARLAKSDPALWADILVSNRAAMLRAISSFSKSLSQFDRALKKGDSSALRKLVQKANQHSR